METPKPATTTHFGLLVSMLIAAATGPAHGESPTPAAAALQRLVAAYPAALDRLEGGELVWRDGTRMPVDDGRGDKAFDLWLADPDVEDMLRIPYPPGDVQRPPARGEDPGRARNAAFFERMYGKCGTGDVERHLVDVVWLPRKSGQRLRVTRVNGVAARLDAVSKALDALPARFDGFLIPAAGAYVCRAIAGTGRVSGHGYGIAVDIAVARSHYWRWNRPGADGGYAWRNSIPIEIVRIFESHGFIWGGRWHHYDTMHFEYRPELLAPTAALPPCSSSDVCSPSWPGSQRMSQPPGPPEPDRRSK